MINNNFRFFVAVSAFAHLLIAIILILGLPSFKRLPDEQMITFEVLPVSDFTNIKTQKVQKEKSVEAEDAKEIKKSSQESAASEPDKPKPTPVPEPEAPKPAPAPEKPVEKTPELIKSDQAEPVKKDPEPKPEELKKEPPKEMKKKNKEVDITDSLLITLEKESEGKKLKSRTESRPEKSDNVFNAQGMFDDERPLSITEKQSVRQQIERNWNVPAGAKNASDIEITLKIALKPDGELMKVSLVSQKCPIGSAVVCQAAVDSAIRAVHQASPFQNLSATRYNAWKEFNLAFDPSNIAG